MNKDEHIKQQQAYIEELEKENEQLKLMFATCSACKNADLYIPSYTYPFFDPKCKITGKSIKPENNACRDFKICGRTGR